MNSRAYSALLAGQTALHPQLGEPLLAIEPAVSSVKFPIVVPEWLNLLLFVLESCPNGVELLVLCPNCSNLVILCANCAHVVKFKWKCLCPSRARVVW